MKINPNIYETKIWKEKSMHPGGLKLTKKIIEESKLNNGKILDLGCGKGESINYLKDIGFEVYGLDISEKLIEENKRNIKDIDFIKFDLESNKNLPYEDNFFDGVLIECVLNLLENKEFILKEIYRILKDDGLILINDLMTLEKNNMGNLFTYENWINLIESFNYEIIYIKEERNILKDFILKSIWEGQNICEKVCVPKGANINNMSYISLITRKKV